MFKELYKKSGLKNDEIGRLFPEHSYTLLGKWRSGKVEAPKSAVDFMRKYLEFMGRA